MPQTINDQKNEIAQTLSFILEKAPDLILKNDPDVLKFNFEKAVQKATQLYYLNLYQVKNVEVDEHIKKATEEDIIKQYQAMLANLMITFKQVEVEKKLEN
ncbi:MAG: hypothetical protein V1898_03630 [Patescibacteria group bacterium]